LAIFHIKLQTYIMQWQVTRKHKVQLAGGL